jgi:hypothetical protein
VLRSVHGSRRLPSPSALSRSLGGPTSTTGVTSHTDEAATRTGSPRRKCNAACVCLPVQPAVAFWSPTVHPDNSPPVVSAARRQSSPSSVQPVVGTVRHQFSSLSLQIRQFSCPVTLSAAARIAPVRTASVTSSISGERNRSAPGPATSERTRSRTAAVAGPA